MVIIPDALFDIILIKSDTNDFHFLYDINEYTLYNNYRDVKSSLFVPTWVLHSFGSNLHIERCKRFKHNSMDTMKIMVLSLFDLSPALDAG